MSAPRLLFIHPEGNVTNNPHCSAMLQLLGQAGFVCDILIPDRDDIPAGELYPNCFAIKAPVPIKSMTDHSLITRDLSDPAAIAQQIKWFAALRPKYSYVIGIDRGIIEADMLARVTGAKLALLSYEIYYEGECPAEYKPPEIEACREVRFAICQDRLRGADLCRENHIDPQKLILMPVAGEGIRTGPRLTLMHEALGLSPDTKIILYMGELAGEWTGVKRVIDCADTLPPGWVLVLHHRFSNNLVAHLVEDLKPGAQSRVLFSPFSALPFSEMYQLLHSVDLGVAFYDADYKHQSSGTNCKHIGLASGKFATYLQHGVPGLVNTTGEMSELVQRFGAGLVIDDLKTLPAALREFEKVPYEERRRRAWSLFESHFDQRSKIQPLIAALSA